MRVKIFIASQCSQCDQAKQYLGDKRIAFEEIDLSRWPEQRETLVQKTGFSMVPQIQIDNQFIVGFDPKKIDELLKEG